VIEPRKSFTVVGADTFIAVEGRIVFAVLGLARRSHRGLWAGHAHIGVPQEPGRSDRLREE
jgi:hypothetical protein